MASLRKNELAALGLVNRQPMHGYALSRAIGRFGLDRWTTLSRSSIYAAFRRLRHEGAVSVTRERESNAPERSVYHITPQGGELLRELLREALSYVGPEDRFFYLGLAFADALQPHEIIPLLEQRRALLRETIDKEWQACAAAGASPGEGEHFSVMTRAGIRHFEIEVEVCGEIIDVLRANPHALLPGGHDGV